MINATSKIRDSAAETVAKVKAVGPPSNPIESIIVTASVSAEL